MPFSLSKWLTKLAKSDRASSSSSDRKYATSDGMSSSDGGDGEAKRIPAVVVLGGSHGVTTHLSAVCDLIAEALHGVHLRVSETDVANVRAATEDAVLLEAEHLLLLNGISDQDDTLSVGTVRMPLHPTTSVNAPRGTQTLPSNGEPLRQVLVLFFPALLQTQAHRVVAEVESSARLSIDVLGVLGCDGSSPSAAVLAGGATARSRATDLLGGDVQRDEVFREFQRQRVSCSAPLLTFPLGATAHATLEMLRPRLDVVCNCSRNATVSVSVPKPGEHSRDVASSQCGGGDSNMFLSGRSVSYRRLGMCRTEALRALRTITANLIRSNGAEERFRILATGSERFDLVFGKSPNAMQVLRNIGFADCDDTGRRIDTTRTKLAWGESVEPSVSDGLAHGHRLMLSQDTACAALPEMRRLASDLEEELLRRETSQPTAPKGSQSKK